MDQELEFEDAPFTISLDEPLDTVFSHEPVLYIIHQCCGGVKKIYILRSSRPITYRVLIRQLIRQGLRPRCNHLFLEGLDVVGYQTYALSFGS
jgi:hypothetical protein